MKTTVKTLLLMIALSGSIQGYANDNSKTVAYTEFEKIVELTTPLTILDIRTPEEYSSGHIPDAININFFDKDFTSLVENAVPGGQNIALYCRSGKRSAEALSALKGKGYDISELEGGILAWEKGGLPITTGPVDIYFTEEDKKVEIQSLIHASFRIAFEGKKIEIDPVGKLGDRTTDYSEFPKADLILVTHEHHDHLDPEAIKTLSKSDTIVIANPNSVNILGYGEAMRNGDKKQIGDITIEAVPAYNVSPDRLQFHPKGRDNGYVLTLGKDKGLRIYIAGDTEVISEMEELKDIDIAFLPCNLPYTMTPDQLIKAAEIIRPKVLYPYHYGTTDLSSITPALAPEGIYVRIRPFDP